jgi:hypothetical protein
MPLFLSFFGKTLSLDLPTREQFQDHDGYDNSTASDSTFATPSSSRQLIRQSSVTDLSPPIVREHLESPNDPEYLDAETGRSVTIDGKGKPSSGLKPRAKTSEIRKATEQESVQGMDSLD